jgi:autotransporter-associated beta strand protein
LGFLRLADHSGSHGVYNLNGGTLILKSLAKGTTGGTAEFNFGRGTLQASGSFSTSLPMNMTATIGASIVNTNGYNVTFSGDLSGNGHLIKNGAGMLTLGGANSYSGMTTVNQGTLNVTGSLNSAGTTYVYNSGTILTGTGSVGAVTAANGGAIAPGAVGAIGTLTLAGNLDLVSDGKLLVDLNAASSDLIAMSGATAALNGFDLTDITFTLLSSLVAGTNYTLIDAMSITGALGTMTTTTLDGLVATLSISNGSGDLILSLRNAGVVPEPASMFIWGAAGLLGLAFARRRRKSMSC